MSKPDLNDKIIIITGEVSGDLHGANLVNSLSKIRPDIEVHGVGGQRMEKAGAKLIHNIDNMSVVGAVEVAGKFLHIYKIYTEIKKNIREGGYGAIVLIDYPTMNLRLARFAKECGVPVVYFIGPQVWAWRMDRINTILKYVDKMLVILPFEEAMYKKYGVDASFVGHPFVDIVRPEMSKDGAKDYFGVDKAKKVIGIMPGSRMHEIGSLLEDMLKACCIIQNKVEDIEFILPLADTIDKEYVFDKISRYPLDIKIIRGNNYDSINICDFLIIASGSATLEAALLEVPMVITYKVNIITYLIAKMVVKIPRIGLVNIVAGKDVVPELIQGNVTPEKIAGTVIHQLENLMHVKEELKKIKLMLGDGNACEKAATAIDNLLSSRLQPVN